MTRLESIVGVGPEQLQPDPEALLEAAASRYDRASVLARNRERQEVVFSGGPVGLVFNSDLHFGDNGVDVKGALADAELVLNTPGLYMGGVVGDLVNNFIVGRLLSLRLRSSVAVPDEWSMARRYLDYVTPKLIAVCGGNHDAWTAVLSGVDMLGQLVPESHRTVLYDPYQVDYTVVVDGVRFPGRLRHRWRLRSMYNQSHGIEQAARFGADFRWGVGAHYHEGAVARGFTIGSDTRLALVCGSYKHLDEYAREMGFVTHSRKAAVGVLLDPDTDSMTGFDDIKMLAKVLRGLHGE